MSGYLNLITPTLLKQLIENNKKISETLFPEIIKRLIDATYNEMGRIRIPTGDSIQETGFDGIIIFPEDTKYVSKGTSVWEFGTDKNASQKLKDDLRKRTNNPLDINIKKATFYFCTPRTLREATRGKYTNRQDKYSRQWKEVIIYDSQIICDWINQTPCVCAWLLEKYYSKEIDISTVCQEWKKISSETKPKLKESFFDFDYSFEIDDLGANQICVIKAKDCIDSYGYIITKALKYRDKNIVIAKNSNTLRKINEIAKNHVIISKYYSGDIEAKNNNTIVLCQSTYTNFSSKEILPDRTHEMTERALKEMGMDIVRTNIVIKATHCKTYSIIRKLSSGNTPKQIEWKNKVEQSIVENFLYVQLLNNEVQEKLLSKLACQDTNKLINSLNDYLQLNDSPIIDNNGTLSIVSPTDIVSAYNISPNSNSYKNANSLLKEMIRSLDENDRWDIYDLSDDRLIQAMECLSKCYVYANSGNNENAQIDNDVEEILSYQILINNLRLRQSLLPILSEASPKTILTFIEENGLKFIEESNFIYNNNYLFESIKIISKYKEYYRDACIILSRLIDDKISITEGRNKECVDLLVEIIMPLNTIVGADISVKEETFKEIANINPKIATIIATALHNASMYSYPQNIRGEIYNEQNITINDYYKFNFNICNYLFQEKRIFDYKLVEAVIDHNWHYYIDDFKKLSELYDADKFSIKEEVKLLSILWQRHNNLGNKKNEKLEKESISAWIDVVNRSYNNVNILLFTNFYYSPFKLKQRKTMSFSEESERVNAMRRRELNKIRRTMNGYTEIISEIIHDDYNWGIFIATNDRDKTYEFTEKLLEKTKVCDGSWNN